MTWGHITAVWVWLHKGTGALIALLPEWTTRGCELGLREHVGAQGSISPCLLYTSDAADETSTV